MHDRQALLNSLFEQSFGTRVHEACQPGESKDSKAAINPASIGVPVSGGEPVHHKR
jgi:hypothetical protein